MLLQIKSSFLHVKLLFDHITPLLNVKKHLSIPSKPWELQPKLVPKENWTITETIQQQSQQQISQTKETLK